MYTRMVSAGAHLTCGQVHDSAEPCRPLAGSPAGRLDRVYRSAAGELHPALARLRALRQLLDDLADQELDAVAEARDEGCTWAEIGQAWGTTRQGAFNKWGSATTRRSKATRGGESNAGAGTAVGQ